MPTNNQLKTFCLHLAVQIFSSQSEQSTDSFQAAYARDIVEAAEIFEAYLLTNEELVADEEAEQVIGFTPDSNILSFADLNNPTDEDADETPPEKA